MIFGMDEERGIASAVAGMDIENVELWLNGLDSMIRQTIQPRITGIVLHPITLSDGKTVVIMQIPRSWALPHAVTYAGSFRFFARNASGKYPLDVTDLRALFAVSESQHQQHRTFRTERMGRIVSGETPLPLPKSAQLVVHLLPLNAFDPAAQVDLGKHSGIVRDQLALLRRDLAPRYRYNFDGFLLYQPLNAHQQSESYTQFFRNGMIEWVDAGFLFQPNVEKPFINSALLERSVCEAVSTALQLYQHLLISPPYLVMLSLTGVKGYFMAFDESRRLMGHTIDREMLLVPEVLAESLDQPVSQLLRQIFDALWQAAGYPRSLHYSEDGLWMAST